MAFYYNFTLSVGGNNLMEEKKIDHDSHKQHTTKKDESYTFSKVSLWQVVSAVLGILLIVSLFTGGFGIGGNDTNKGSNGGTVQQPTNPTQPSAPSAVVDVDVDDDPVIGDKNAPVTIVEFSDFQCPFCQRFYQQSYLQIKEKYVDTGKVKVVFRDFPLSIHQYAQASAEAAECVRDQTNDATYFAFHDKLFETQTSWASVGESAIVDLAGQMDGVDKAKVQKCLDDGKFSQEVSDDFNYGISVGVSGTPTVFVNGVRIVGAQPYAAFESAIESALEG